MDNVKALIDEQKFNAALELLDAELDRAPRNVQALLLRSTLRTRRSQLEGALVDAERATAISNGSEEAQLRRAICLFRLKRVNEAFSLMQYFPEGQEAQTWRELIAHGSTGIVEVPRIPPVELPVTVASRTNSSAGAVAGAATPTASAGSSGSSGSSTAPRMDWYQSSSTVTLTLYKKGLDPKSTRIAIGAHSVSVDSDEFHWATDFANGVDPELSSYDLTAFKVEFSLKKEAQTTWTSLEASKPSANSAGPSQSSAGPSQGLSYNKWEHLDDDDDNGESDPMAFFKNLYKDATPETRRAMMKSYVESNGTTLSTNWDEVSRGQVETHPPQDMEAKKWTE